MLGIISLVFFLEISVADGYNAMYQPDGPYDFETYEYTGYINLGVTAYIMQYLYITGSMKMNVNLMTEIIHFDTRGVSSFFEAGIKINGLSLGYRYFCTHPIAPLYTSQKFLRFYDEYGGEIFLRYETGKIKLDRAEEILKEIR